MSGASGLELRGLVRRGEFALAVDFAVASGEIVALSGPNGVGKTTVLRYLAGLGGSLSAVPEVPAGAAAGGATDRAASGTAGGATGASGTEPCYLLDGRNMRSVPTDRRGLGVVFQEPRLVAHMTAIDNVAFAATLGGVRKSEARARAAELLGELGLPAAKHSLKPQSLSGGQRGRVAIARALAVPSPRLRLFDEPLAAIDAPSRPLLRSVLAAHLAESSAPTLLVTHDPADVRALATRDIPLGRSGEVGEIGEIGETQEIGEAGETD